jgi:HD-GYP domain-containing protein (c-di-GMP phosphodiesterase class II)
LGSKWILFPIIIGLIVGILFYHFIRLIVELKEEELSKNIYEYRSYLRQEAERISKTKNIQELLSRFFRNIKNAVNPVFVKIFLFNESLNKYVLEGEVNNETNNYLIPKKKAYDQKSPLVLYLKEEKEPIELNCIKYLLNFGKIPVKRRHFLVEIKEEMERMEAVLCLPILSQERLFGFILLGKRLSTPYLYTSDDLKLFSTMASYAGEAIHGFLLREENIQLILSSMQAMVQSVEAKDQYTGGHSSRVAEISYLLGQELQDEMVHIPNALVGLKRAALLHDVGKIGIPESILNKIDSLTAEEFEIIKTHPQKGVELIGSLKKWLGDDIILGILHHHENFNGSGYPIGEKGERIHIYGRIIRVADAFDALTTDRPYRPAFTKKEVIEELKRMVNTHFDPKIIEKFMVLCKKKKI